MANDLKRIIGWRIRARRLALNLTQEHVADAIARTVETVSNIERGKAFPGLETLEQICRVLDIQMSRLFDAEEAVALSPLRIELQERLILVAGVLSDADLEIAVHQVEILARGRQRSA